MSAPDLYETDFAAWAEQQARALRNAQDAGVNLPVDWQNVAEELDGLARSDRRELRSRIETILEHLLKLACSPAGEPRAGWRDTIRRSRDAIAELLDENRSLRDEVGPLIARAAIRVRERVGKELADRGEDQRALLSRLGEAPFLEDQVLGDWFPPEHQA